MSFKLRRFSAERQEQIDQLISYAQLLGLSGTDLVSIGGKMNREQAKTKKSANLAIINGFRCLAIGNDTINEYSHRFKLKTANGAYNLELYDGWAIWEVVSLRTKVVKKHTTNIWEYELPKTHNYRLLSKYSMLLDIAASKFKLDF